MREEEASAFVTSLYESHYSTLTRYAWRATSSLTLAEELVQQCFLDLYEALLKGTKVENPRAWTFSVVRRAIKTRIREHLNSPVDEVNPDFLESLPCEDAAGAGVEMWEVTRMFSLLSRREEEALLLRLSSLKYDEIAAGMGISPKAVSTLLTRALQKLRRALHPGESTRTSTTNVEKEKDRRTLQ